MRFCFFLLTIPLLFGCPIINPVDNGDGEIVAIDGDVIFPALKGGLPAPSHISLSMDGLNPILSWQPNMKAAYYRIYRKSQKEEKYAPVLNGEIVCATTFIDKEISRATHNDIFYYRISTVDQFGKEGFLSNPLLITVSGSSFSLSADFVSASQGYFDTIKDGDTTIIEQNKLGVLLKIARPISYRSSEADVWAFNILRKEDTQQEYQVVQSEFSPEQSYFDKESKKEVFSYIDVPPKAGVLYNYKVVPINGLNQLGILSDAFDGFVYGSPQILSFDSFPIDGKPGALNIHFDLPSHCYYVNIYATKDLTTPFVKIGSRHKINLENSTLVTPIDCNDIFSALGDESSLYGTYYYYIEGSYSLFNEDALGETFTTPPSLVKEGSIYAASLATLELPLISVNDGEKSISSLIITKPICLSWAYPLDSAITGYKIYRSTNILFDSGLDKTDWGQPVAVIPLPQNKNEPIKFSDSTADMSFGAYYYKVNPVAGDLESHNNLTLSNFAKAALFPSEITPIAATIRESATAITISYPALGDTRESLFYTIENKNINRDWSTIADSVSAVGGNEEEFVFPTTVIGLQDFRVKAVAVFKNGEDVLEKRVGTITSQTVQGAIEIDDIQWVKLVMQTIVHGQKRILPAWRQESNVIKGGYYKKVDDTLTFLRRSYMSYCSNEKYDGLKFNAYPSVCNSIDITGNLYHLYFDKGTSARGFDVIINLSYSASAFPDSLSSETDKLEKRLMPLSVGGVYSGEIQLWFKNGGYDRRNDEAGLLPLGDYPSSELYVLDNTRKLRWFKESWGLYVTSEDTAGSNIETSYLVKRDTSNAFVPISHGQVGVVQ